MNGLFETTLSAGGGVLVVLWWWKGNEARVIGVRVKVES